MPDPTPNPPPPASAAPTSASSPSVEHRPVAGAIELIHLDDAIAVVNKPAGLGVTPERFGASADTLTNRLWHWLVERTGQPAAAVRPLIVHRLDRDVSGVIVYARTAEAHRDLSQQFEAHTTAKTYLALAHGRFDPATGRIDIPVGPLPKTNHRTRGKIFANAPGAKPAVTEYEQVEVLGASSTPIAVLHLKPSTGRRHQLRVHLATLGHPLLCDPLYGAAGTRGAGYPAEKPILTRVALHAMRLQFRHPDGQTVEYSAPLAADLEQVLAFLRAMGG